MLKKDVGLLNISLYSSLYKKFVNGIENNDNLEFDYQTLLG